MFALWYIYLGWEEYRRVQGVQWNLPNSQRWTSKQKQTSPQPTNQTNGKQASPKSSPPSTPNFSAKKPTLPSPATDKNIPAKVTPPPPPSPFVPAKPSTPAPQNVQPSPTRDQPIPKPPPPVQPPKPSPQQPIPQSRSKFEPDPELSPESRIFKSTKINDDPPSKISPIMLDSPQAPKPPTNNFPNPSQFSAAPDFRQKITPKPDDKFNNFGRQSSKQKTNEIQNRNVDEPIPGKTEQTIESVNQPVESEIKSTEKIENSDMVSIADGNIDVEIHSQSVSPSETLSTSFEVKVQPTENTEKVHPEIPDLMAHIDRQVESINLRINNQSEPIIDFLNPFGVSNVESIKDMNSVHQESPDLVANIEEDARKIDSQCEQLSGSFNPFAENNVKSKEEITTIYQENFDFLVNIDGSHTEQSSEFVTAGKAVNSKSVHLENSETLVGREEELSMAAVQRESEGLTRPTAMEVSFGNSEDIETQAAGRVTVTYFDNSSSSNGGILLWNAEMEDNARFIDSASETFSRMSIKSMPSADSILHGSDEVMTAGKQRVCKKGSWPRRVSISDDPPAVYLAETASSSRSADQLQMPPEEQIPFDVKMRRELELTAAVLREDWLRKKQMSIGKQSQSDEEMVLSSNESDDTENVVELTNNEQSDTFPAE